MKRKSAKAINAHLGFLESLSVLTGDNGLFGVDASMLSFKAGRHDRIDIRVRMA